MSLKEENEKLRNKIQQLSLQRNQEILELQHQFAEKYKAIQRQSNSEQAMKLRTENESLHQQIKELTEKTNTLTRQIKEIKDEQQRYQESAESLRKDIELAKSGKSNPMDEFSEFIEPFEKQVKELAKILSQKQAEIDRLQNVVHQECEKRIHLQAILDAKH